MNRRNFLTATAALLAIMAMPAMGVIKKLKYRPATEKEINEAGYLKAQLPTGQDGKVGKIVWLHSSLENTMTIDNDVVLQFQSNTDEQIDNHFSNWPNTILRPFVKLTDKRADKVSKPVKKGKKK